ncbi:hypothetical protein M514_09510 [Trichuris suis]|uniref:Uncharacterized protein n=1 Tax=Trichuris suis TaxID=68888 RepID=A0A085NA41_9BILA|nr:hypothetical protein M514_09510 [Trichuris suis]
MKAVEATPQTTVHPVRPESDRLQHMVWCVETVGNLLIADSDLRSTNGEVHSLQSESCALLVHYSKDDRACRIAFLRRNSLNSDDVNADPLSATTVSDCATTGGTSSLVSLKLRIAWDPREKFQTVWDPLHGLVSFARAGWLKW